VFRVDPGTKLDAATERESVAFEVDAADEASRTLPLHPWAPGDKTRYVRVRPRSVTGRRIGIPDELAFTRWG
jgi:hypothetical protein